MIKVGGPMRAGKHQKALLQRSRPGRQDQRTRVVFGVMTAGAAVAIACTVGTGVAAADVVASPGSAAGSAGSAATTASAATAASAAPGPSPAGSSADPSPSATATTPPPTPAPSSSTPAPSASPTPTTTDSASPTTAAPSASPSPSRTSRPKPPRRPTGRSGQSGSVVQPSALPVAALVATSTRIPIAPTVAAPSRKPPNPGPSVATSARSASRLTDPPARTVASAGLVNTPASNGCSTPARLLFIAGSGASAAGRTGSTMADGYSSLCSM